MKMGISHSMAELQDFFRNVMQVKNEDLIRVVLQLAKPRFFHSGDVLIREGEQLKEFGFLMEGAIIAGTCDTEGKTYIDCIETTPGVACIDAPALKNGLISTTTIKMLTDSTLCMFPMDRFLSMIHSRPDAGQLYLDSFEKAMIRHSNVRKALISNDATGRYLWFCEEYPELEKVLSGKQIASYLHISPVTLSRIRKALRTEPTE